MIPSSSCATLTTVDARLFSIVMCKRTVKMSPNLREIRYLLSAFSRPDNVLSRSFRPYIRTSYRSDVCGAEPERIFRLADRG